jgi:hypothetical protein
MAADDASGFLSRWARRKEQVRAGESVVAEPVAVALVEAPTAVAVPMASQAEHLPTVAAESVPPLPTLADVALLTRESDYSRFVASGVDEGVKRAAMKKLFTDPHFNVMDGLDTYIDDYGKPDPIPLAMLRQLNQSKVLRLFDDDDEDEKNADRLTAAATATATATTAETTEAPSPPDDDPDLRLQQDHAAGRPGADEGAGA